MNNMKINIPEGFEIDKENSSLETGEIVFKEVEKKYSSEFYYSIISHGKTITKILSETHAGKLDILDTLLCLRDEYNRIDGFKEGFRFGESNWCIANINNTLDFDSWGKNNKIMHFGKEETAKLFLKNFEEQLEQVKEFL